MKGDKMSINKSLCYLVIFVLLFAMLVNGVLAVSASDSNDIQVTATTSASVKQGNSGYCYVYIDSLEDLSALSVTLYYNSDKIKVESSYVYNTVSCTMYDKAVEESSVQFSYILDGNGEATKTQLFYFRYTVLSDAEVGDAYFDIVVSEAYDSSLNALSVSGSRCSFAIGETVVTKACSIYSSSPVSTSVGEEFELSYRLSTYQIASGSFVINYDPELFEVVNVTNGTFCDGKIVDVNTNLSGAVYVSFVGTEYKNNTNLMTVKFKTLKNTADTSSIKLTVIELFDMEMNPISCSGYTTTAKVIFDETYTEDAPNMSLQTSFDAENDKMLLTVKLDKNSMLGAGDFVLNFDTTCLTYSSVQKGFSPTFFNINNKGVADGILKFSIISLSDITDEQTVLTVTFDVKHACEDKIAEFEINGSGLTDSLTNSILLNFVDASVTITLKHSNAAAIVENKIEATCTEDGSYDSVVYCTVCAAELSREAKTIDKLGHDHSTEWMVDVEPTCTTTGSKSHHCSRCEDKADVTTIPQNGHSYGDWVTEAGATPTSTGLKFRICSICTNKETEVIPQVTKLKFAGASLSLHHNLAINYKVDKALFEGVGYTNPYVIFEMNGVKTKVSKYSASGDFYSFTLYNIAPNQMNDTVYATLYATYDGVEYLSTTIEYSIAEYCYSMLEIYTSDKYAELRTLLVDLLHYGTQAQLYTNYNTSNLVDEKLSDEQLLWGTSEEPTLTNALDTTYETVETPTAKWKGAGITLNDSVCMRFMFTTDSIEGLSVKIKSATNEWIITSDNFIKENGAYYVYFNALNAGQMSEKVYLTIYNGDVAISNTVCYSIESYAYEKQSSTIEHLSDLVKAMMKYGNSAYAYVN